MHLRCPYCRSPIPERTTRCAICGRDPHQPPAQPDETSARLALGLTPSPDGKMPAPSAVIWWPLALGIALVTLAALAIVAVGLLAADAGLGGVAWPALVGLSAVLLLGALLQVERRRRARAQTNAASVGAETSALSDLELVYLFAARFAAPAGRADGFQPPLQRTPVRADEAAWRAVAASLLDLADADVLELEAHTLPTPREPLHVIAVRLVRPLPPGDAFAARLLHPLARRGVGASTTVSELVSQCAMAQRHPARALLDSAQAHLKAAGYYRQGGDHSGGKPPPLARAWLDAALFRPLQLDAARLAAAQPALAALEARMAAWDERDPALVAALRDEVLAAFLRAQARARQAIG